MGDYYERLTRQHDAELVECQHCGSERRAGGDWYGDGTYCSERCADEHEEETT